MAQAQPVDQQDHDEYLEQRYGYSRIPKESTSKPAETSVAPKSTIRAPGSRQPKNRFTTRKSQSRGGRTANSNNAPRHSRSKRRGKLTKALHPDTAIKRGIVWAINLWFFWWQVFFGTFFLVTLGFAVLVYSNTVTNTLSDLIAWASGVNIEYIFMLFWGLLWILGWINILILWIFFSIAKVRSTSGHNASTKKTRLITALVLYALPFVNLIPWVFIWSGFALRHPK